MGKEADGLGKRNGEEVGWNWQEEGGNSMGRRQGDRLRDLRLK